MRKIFLLDAVYRRFLYKRGRNHRFLKNTIYRFFIFLNVNRFVSVTFCNLDMNYFLALI